MRERRRSRFEKQVLDEQTVQAIAKLRDMAFRTSGLAYEYPHERAREAGRMGGLARSAKQRNAASDKERACEIDPSACADDEERELARTIKRRIDDANRGAAELVSADVILMRAREAVRAVQAVRGNRETSKDGVSLKRVAE